MCGKCVFAQKKGIKNLGQDKSDYCKGVLMKCPGPGWYLVCKQRAIPIYNIAAGEYFC